MSTFNKLASLFFKLKPTSKRWRYRLEEDFVYKSKHLDGIVFHSPWLIIEDGTIIVKKGYTWDGVTPAFYFLGFWWGVWDGPKGKDGKVTSWKATLVHDAFCQFIGLIEDIKKEDTVGVFEDLLIDNDSPKFMCEIYPWFVKYFGPQDWS